MGLPILSFIFEFGESRPHIKAVTSNEWPQRRRSTLSWQLLSKPENSSGERWTVVWDTKRKPGTDGRNSATETCENTALDRARHMLRLGFIVYEIRQPSGLIFLEETGIRQRLGLPAAVS